MNFLVGETKVTKIMLDEECFWNLGFMNPPPKLERAKLECEFLHSLCCQRLLEATKQVIDEAKDKGSGLNPSDIFNSLNFAMPREYHSFFRIHHQLCNNIFEIHKHPIWIRNFHMNDLRTLREEYFDKEY